MRHWGEKVHLSKLYMCIVSLVCPNYSPPDHNQSCRLECSLSLLNSLSLLKWYIDHVLVVSMVLGKHFIYVKIISKVICVTITKFKVVVTYNMRKFLNCPTLKLAELYRFLKFSWSSCMLFGLLLPPQAHSFFFFNHKLIINY